MPVVNHCPQCGKELEWDGQYVCSECEKHYLKRAFCPQCGSELEKLQACGAVNYFCNSCNEMKSKSAARYEYQPLD